MKKKLNCQFFITFAIIIASLFNVAQNCAANDNAAAVSIPVAMATDNNYLMPTMVSIVSAAENANPKTKLRFYIMVTSDLSEENRGKINKLNEKLENCDITLVNMEDAFKEFEKGRWGIAMYYRLKLASVLKDESKCIYLDSDTLVLKDLAEMYNQDISDKYVAGVPDGYRLCKDYASELGIKDMTQYICSGSLLWNLDRARKDGIEEKFEQFLKKTYEEGKRLLFPDQDAINTVCYGKIIDMPFKYGSIIGFMYCSEYEKDPYLYKLLKKEDWEEGKKNPVVLHFVGKKPWDSRRVKFCDLWKKYYFDLEKYGITK